MHTPTLHQYCLCEWACDQSPVQPDAGNKQGSHTSLTARHISRYAGVDMSLRPGDVGSHVPSSHIHMYTVVCTNALKYMHVHAHVASGMHAKCPRQVTSHDTPLLVSTGSTKEADSLHPLVPK